METDPSMTAQVINQLIATGPVAVILAVAVWWQTKGQQALINQLNTEREERMDSMDKEIVRLRDRSDKCEADRIELGHRIARRRRTVTCTASSKCSSTGCSSCSLAASSSGGRALAPS